MEIAKETVHISKRFPPLHDCGPTVKNQAKRPKEVSDDFKKICRHSRDNRKNDTRFREPAFCRAVRQVLEYLGEEPIFGNFRKYDGLIYWEAFAESINHPKKLALCHVLDCLGQEITKDGKPVVVAREIEACSKSEACEILARESKRFIKWW